MSVDGKFLGLRNLVGRQRKTNGDALYAARPGTIRPGHLRPGSLAQFAESQSRRKTTDLIKILLGHGARSARLNQPRTHIAINVYMPNGQRALRLKMSR